MANSAAPWWSMTDAPAGRGPVAAWPVMAIMPNSAWASRSWPGFSA